jgi:hypothetical protein
VQQNRQTQMKKIPQQPPDKKRKIFDAVLENNDPGMDTAFVSIPFDVEKIYGTKGHVKVKAWFDGHPYRGILANMGSSCHVIGVRKDIRMKMSKKIGDTIKVELELDTEERVVEIPKDLKNSFAKSPEAEKFFNSLSYTNRKEYANWITSAKKNETREKRLAETIQKLSQGKKNPSEK